jgi:Zn-dependent peptidase ImmA (M78 family)/transcriptional regulator with XRE-family HTH domain
VANRKLAEYQPERLTQARKLRGLSMSDLAIKTGLSRQSISLFESKNRGITPSPETLINLSNKLNVNITFFTLPLRKSENEHMAASAYNFRSLKSASKLNRESAKVCLHILAGMVDYFEEYVEVSNQLPIFDVPHFSELSDDQIEGFATAARRYWGLGDGVIPDLTKLLENKGVIIAYLDFANGIEGVSAWIENKPVVVLSNKATAVRSRASLAHELGHLILHQTLTNEELENKETLDRIESQAWHFAGCFLMPQSTISNEVYSTNIDNLTLVKSRWLVSIGMILQRVLKIKLISEHQYVRARQKLASLNYLKKEPLDDEIPHEESKFFTKLMEFLDENNLSDRDNIYFSLGLPDDIMSQTLGVRVEKAPVFDNVVKLKFNN